MIGLFKSKNPYEQPARRIYAAVSEHARDPAFYGEYGVPDTVDGRFDLLLVLLFTIIYSHQHPQGRQFAQALFDIMFINMDQSLREAGIGDMGVPKHMRRMMQAFNGRMHAYAAAVRDGTLDVALARNLYGTLEDKVDGPPAAMVSRMADYVRENLEFIAGQDFKKIAEGMIVFAPLQPVKKYGT